MNTIVELENAKIEKVLTSDGSELLSTKEVDLKFQYLPGLGAYIVALKTLDGRETQRINANFVVMIVWK
jgi:hypothetical protein